ncbi:MAG TPA: terminase [Paludibacteraceae bacterium]|nr:terminase [Paludibacteraceae bacterium]
MARFSIPILPETDIMQTKKELEEKKVLARQLYMQGTLQNDISDRVGVSKNTVCRWVDDGKWATIRAGVQITRPELVNKALGAVNKLLDQIYESQDPELICKLPDQLAKFASFIDKLDKQANVVSTIDVFIAFEKWIEHRASFDSEITEDFLQTLRKYHNIYVQQSMSPK